MLNKNDYKNYEKQAYELLSDTGRNPLQIAKYFLAKWGEFERNISTLNFTEKRQARALFFTLKKLTADERQFLSLKYRAVVENKAYVNDKTVAKKLDMKLQRYVELRKAIECKFFCYLVIYSKTKENVVGAVF